MGNVPSAVKHCLSYQQLLREHLWIADSVAGPLDPAQVPPRGPGCPHPLAQGQRASPPVMSPLHPMALPAAVCGVGPHPLQGFPTSLCYKHVDPLYRADPAKSLPVAICRAPEGNCSICFSVRRDALYNIICGFRQPAKDSVLIFSSFRVLRNKEDKFARM